MTAIIVPLTIAPKAITGSKRNCAWSILYDPATRSWGWEVNVIIQQPKFMGVAATEAEARRLVDDIVKRLVSK